MLSVLHDLSPVLDTLTRNEATFQPIFDGIQAFASKTDSATHGLYINFDLTSILDPNAFNTPDQIKDQLGLGNSGTGGLGLGGLLGGGSGNGSGGLLGGLLGNGGSGGSSGSGGSGGSSSGGGLLGGLVGGLLGGHSSKGGSK
jgi:hypothetical protein